MLGSERKVGLHSTTLEGAHSELGIGGFAPMTFRVTNGGPCQIYDCPSCPVIVSIYSYRNVQQVEELMIALYHAAA
jgi:hypothetical protein